METNKAGEANVNTADVNAGNSSATASEQAAKIAELEARLAKETKEKEIYRGGLLAAKDLGKTAKRITSEELNDPEKLEKAIEAKIQDKELEQKAATETEQTLSAAEKLRKENEELRRSLEAAQTAGFSGGAGTGSGHNENSESKSTSYWSDGQKNELRQIYQSRGLYSHDQIEKMVAKAEQIAQSKTALAERGNDLTKTRSR